MLFEIDDSVIDYIESNKISIDSFDKTIFSLENLATSYYLRKHILIGSYRVLSYLKKCNLLSLRAQKIFQEIFSNWSELKSYKVLKRMILLKQGIGEITRVRIEDKVILEVPIVMFEETNLTQEAKLLCEDHKDGEVFIFITKCLMKKSRNNLKLSLKIENGGGQNIGPNYERIITNKDTLCLAIADNDKTYCKDSIKSVWKGLMKKEDFISEKYCLNVRCIENLIPLEIAKKLINKDGYEFLEKIEKSIFSNHLRYFYLRNGLRKDMNNDTSLTIWNEILKSLKVFDYQNIKDLIGENVFDENVLFSGTGSITEKLTRNIKLLEESKPIKKDIEEVLCNFVELCPEYLENEYEELSNLILSWGAAPRGFSAAI